MSQSRSGKLIGILPCNEGVVLCKDGIILFSLHNVHTKKKSLKTGALLYFFLESYMGSKLDTKFFNARYLWTGQRPAVFSKPRPIIYGLKLFRHFCGNIQSAIMHITCKEVEIGCSESSPITTNASDVSPSMPKSMVDNLEGNTAQRKNVPEKPVTRCGQVTKFLPEGDAVLRFSKGFGLFSPKNVQHCSEPLKLHDIVYFLLGDFIGTKGNQNFYHLQYLWVKEKPLKFPTPIGLTDGLRFFREFEAKDALNQAGDKFNLATKQAATSGFLTHFLPDGEAIIQFGEGIGMFSLNRKTTEKVMLNTIVHFDYDGSFGVKNGTEFYYLRCVWVTDRALNIADPSGNLKNIEIFNLYDGDIDRTINTVTKNLLAGTLRYFLPKHSAIVEFANSVGIFSLYDVNTEHTHLELGSKIFFKPGEFIGAKNNTKFYSLSALWTSELDITASVVQNRPIPVGREIFDAFNGDLDKVVTSICSKNIKSGTVIWCINKNEGIIHMTNLMFAWFHQNNITDPETTVESLLHKQVTFFCDCYWSTNSGKSSWSLATLVRPESSDVKNVNLKTVSWDDYESFSKNFEKPSSIANTLWDASLLRQSSHKKCKKMYMMLKRQACRFQKESSSMTKNVEVAKEPSERLKEIPTTSTKTVTVDTKILNGRFTGSSYDEKSSRPMTKNVAVAKEPSERLKDIPTISIKTVTVDTKISNGRYTGSSSDEMSDDEIEILKMRNIRVKPNIGKEHTAGSLSKFATVDKEVSYGKKKGYISSDDLSEDENAIQEKSMENIKVGVKPQIRNDHTAGSLSKSKAFAAVDKELPYGKKKGYISSEDLSEDENEIREKSMQNNKVGVKPQIRYENTVGSLSKSKAFAAVDKEVSYGKKKGYISSEDLSEDENEIREKSMQNNKVGVKPQIRYENTVGSLSKSKAFAAVDKEVSYGKKKGYISSDDLSEHEHEIREKSTAGSLNKFEAIAAVAMELLYGKKKGSISFDDVSEDENETFENTPYSESERNILVEVKPQIQEHTADSKLKKIESTVIDISKLQINESTYKPDDELYYEESSSDSNQYSDDSSEENNGVSDEDDGEILEELSSTILMKVMLKKLNGRWKEAVTLLDGERSIDSIENDDKTTISTLVSSQTVDCWETLSTTDFSTTQRKFQPAATSIGVQTEEAKFRRADSLAEGRIQN